MAPDDHRYFDLKADTNRVELNLQELDEPLVVTGPVKVSTSEAATIFALEQSPGMKSITKDEYASATKAAASKGGSKS